MIMFRPTWEGWAHLVGLRHGRLLDSQLCAWLLWERTAFPMTTDLAYLGAQLLDALEHPMSDEEFMDAQDPEKREADRLVADLERVMGERDTLAVEADRLATELGVVARQLQDMEGQYHEVVADRDRLRAVVDDAARRLYPIAVGTEYLEVGAEWTTKRDHLAAGIREVQHAMVSALDASPTGEDT